MTTPLTPVERTDGSWGLQRSKTCMPCGRFDSKEEAEHAAATANLADQLAVSDPAQY